MNEDTSFLYGEVTISASSYPAPRRKAVIEEQFNFHSQDKVA